MTDDTRSRLGKIGNRPGAARIRRSCGCSSRRFRPRFADALAAGSIDRRSRSPRARAATTRRDVGAALRRERSAFALALAIGDLAGALPLERVTGALSDLADRSLRTRARRRDSPSGRPTSRAARLRRHRARQARQPRAQLFVRRRSDLPATIRTRCRGSAREEPGQAAVRIGQRVIELLQKRDGEGYAFRVDLRLRPSPEVTPIALPVDAAISYYESSALPWERAAFIRAAHGRRRSRRSAAISSTRSIRSSGAARSISARSARSASITRRIRDHYAQGQSFGPGFDLKRGRGGIREIEFFAQIHQLIHGGREPELRAPATLDALAALAAAGRIERRGRAAISATAYRLFRTIEHRLQMVDDRQTHSLPADAERAGQCRAAARPRRRRGAARAARAACRAGRRRSMTRSAAARASGLPRDRRGARGRARRGRLRRCRRGAGARIEGWRSGKDALAARRRPAREAFEAMLPALIEAFGAVAGPMRR